MNKDCFIAEDLLPLYNEGLLQKETSEWLEDHLKSCESCRELAELSKEPIKKTEVAPSIDYEKMMKKNNLKLAIYQIILVAISFFFAMETSLLNNSFGFILSYTILGFVTYLFYQRLLMVITIAFLPNFIWSIVDIVSGTDSHLTFDAILGSFFIAMLHVFFAAIGSLIGFLVLKLREKGE